MPVNIVIIDSGAGGLSIAAELRRRFASANITTVADSAFYPYGNKPVSVVSKRVIGIVRQLAPTMKVDVVVVACNTASTVVLEGLRSEFKFPVVGVVPAIKPAALESKTKVIGLLATPATVERTYVDQLIAQFASDCRVFRYGSSELVHLAEKFVRGEEVDFAKVSAEVEILLNMAQANGMKIDQVVLGCTHFPHFNEYFGKSFPEICFQDSTGAIVSRILSVTDSVRLSVEATEIAKADSHFETMLDGDKIVFEEHNPKLKFPRIFQ